MEQIRTTLHGTRCASTFFKRKTYFYLCNTFQNLFKNAASKDEEKPLLENEDTKVQAKEDDDAESREMINGFKSMTGLWGDIDPENSAWYKVCTIWI